jgi:hypothetical protein
VEVHEEDEHGAVRHLRTMGEGQFFGELGLSANVPRSASVVASTNVTCLVLSPARRTKYDGRGGSARHTGEAEEASEPGMHEGVLTIDVSAHVDDKLAALAMHRSQYPIDADVFPRSMIAEMYGLEHFVPVTPPNS